MKTKRCLIILALLIAFGSYGLAAPLGTAFNYSGKLQQTGNPANGSYDLKFSLFDASTNGVLVAGPVTNSPVTVSNGLFAVTLDFGSDVFNGDARWLEIGVRTNGVGGFTILSPRQTLRPIPYALFASSVARETVAFVNLAPEVQLDLIYKVPNHMWVFTNNATFIHSNGTMRVMVEVWGGGGGGAFRGGGGGGGYGKQVFDLSPGTYSVVVGEGGAAGLGTNSDIDPPAPGSAGGNSNFGSLITSYGGFGGQVGTGGAGGTSTGASSITGSGGGPGSPDMNDGGAAGCGGFGGKLQARSPSTVYGPPSEPGGGGVGTRGPDQQNGAKGRVVIYF